MHARRPASALVSGTCTRLAAATQGARAPPVVLPARRGWVPLAALFPVCTYTHTHTHAAPQGAPLGRRRAGASRSVSWGRPFYMLPDLVWLGPVANRSLARSVPAEG